jgi:hypothetical protein
MSSIPHQLNALSTIARLASTRPMEIETRSFQMQINFSQIIV